MNCSSYLIYDPYTGTHGTRIKESTHKNRRGVYYTKKMQYHKNMPVKMDNVNLSLTIIINVKPQQKPK